MLKAVSRLQRVCEQSNSRVVLFHTSSSSLVWEKLQGKKGKPWEEEGWLG